MDQSPPFWWDFHDRRSPEGAPTPWSSNRQVREGTWMFKEKAQHFPGGVRAARIGKRARRAAAGPGVTSAADQPLLNHRASLRIELQRAAPGVPSRNPPLFRTIP